MGCNRNCLNDNSGCTVDELISLHCGNTNPITLPVYVRVGGGEKHRRWLRRSLWNTIMCMGARLNVIHIGSELLRSHVGAAVSGARMMERD